MARIVEDNKIMLKKLQTAHSNYDIEKWNQEDKKKKKLVKMICRNSDRFVKNPYFIKNSTMLGTATSEHSFYMPYEGGDRRHLHTSSTKKRASYTSLDPNYFPVPNNGSRYTQYQMGFGSLGGIPESSRGRPMSAPKYGNGRRLRNKTSR
jgi:hypothetical protein